MPQRPVTERQIFDAMEEHSEAWVEQLARRAKNQRLALSDGAICAVGDYLQMPALMDELVAVRVAERGPYTLAELNPPWVPRAFARS